MELAPLGLRKATRKTGKERVRSGDQHLDGDLLDFWEWSTSDILSNATRGVLAEYIVAQAVGINTKEEVRDEWANFDLQTPSGIKIKVKSAAFLQSWHQNSLSKITFKVPATRKWNAETNQQASQPTRDADVYVLALLAHTDKATVDPLDMGQWKFYVVATKVLDERKRSQHSITLKSLEALCDGEVTFSGLAAEVNRVAST